MVKMIDYCDVCIFMCVCICMYVYLNMSVCVRVVCVALPNTLMQYDLQ